ncbi:lipopolysaccharide biosynthesis protein, partial [Vibrio kanaloae]
LKIMSSNFIYFGAMWFLLAFSSHFYGMESMGVMSLSISISAPIILFFGMSPRQSIVTDVIVNYKEYNESRVVTLFMSWAFLSLASLFLFGVDEYIYTFILFTTFKFIEGYFETDYAIKTKNKDFDFISKFQVIRSVQVFIFIIFSFLYESIEIAIIAMISYNIIVIKLTKEMLLLNIKFDRVIIYDNLKRTIPISLAACLTILYLNSPRYFLANVGIKELALYSGLINIVAIIRMGIQSYLNTILPFLTESVNNKETRKLFNILVKGVVSIGLVSVLFLSAYYIFGNHILFLLYGNDFVVTNSNVYLCIVYGTLLCLAMIMNNILTSLREFDKQLAFSILLSSLSFALSFILIPKFGLNSSFIILIILCIIQIVLCSRIIFKRSYLL